MMQTEILKKQLQDLVKSINEGLGVEKLHFHQQNKVKKHMSLSGGNGRIWVTTSPTGYDVSLSGQSVEKELYPALQDIFGRSHDGFKQTDAQPYWRTDNFNNVRKAIECYSKTKG